MRRDDDADRSPADVEPDSGVSQLHGLLKSIDVAQQQPWAGALSGSGLGRIGLDIQQRGRRQCGNQRLGLFRSFMGARTADQNAIGAGDRFQQDFGHARHSGCLTAQQSVRIDVTFPHPGVPFHLVSLVVDHVFPFAADPKRQILSDAGAAVAQQVEQDRIRRGSPAQHIERFRTAISLRKPKFTGAPEGTKTSHKGGIFRRVEGHLPDSFAASSKIMRTQVDTANPARSAAERIICFSSGETRTSSVSVFMSGQCGDAGLLVKGNIWT